MPDPTLLRPQTFQDQQSAAQQTAEHAANNLLNQTAGQLAAQGVHPERPHTHYQQHAADRIPLDPKKILNQETRDQLALRGYEVAIYRVGNMIHIDIGKRHGNSVELVSSLNVVGDLSSANGTINRVNQQLLAKIQSLDSPAANSNAASLGQHKPRPVGSKEGEVKITKINETNIDGLKFSDQAETLYYHGRPVLTAVHSQGEMSPLFSSGGLLPTSKLGKDEPITVRNPLNPNQAIVFDPKVNPREYNFIAQAMKQGVKFILNEKGELTATRDGKPIQSVRAHGIPLDTIK